MSTTRHRLSLAAVVFTVLLAQGLLYPGIDELVAALGATADLDASMWFLAAEFTAFVVFATVWGAVSDSTGRRVPFIVLGAAGGATGYGTLAILGTATTLPFAVVLALRVLQGAATVGAFSLAMTMLMDLDGGHGRNMGAAGIAIGAGVALGAPLGGLLYGVGPFVPLSVATVLLLAAAVVASIVTDRPPRDNRRSVVDALVGLRDTPALALPYVFGFIDRATAGFFVLAGNFYFRDALGLDPVARGFVLAAFFVPFALLQYPFGVLSDRVGRTAPIVVGSGLYGLAVIGVGVMPTALLAAAGMLVVGVLGALMAPATMALVTDIAPATQRGTAMGAFNIFGSLGFLAGIVVGGVVATTYDYFAAFAVTGLLEIGIALVALPTLIKLTQGASATFERGEKEESV